VWVTRKALDFGIVSNVQPGHTRLLADVAAKEQNTMKSSQRSIQQTLELRLKEALPTQAWRESILIHRVADPTDDTQQALERDLAIHSLDRSSTLAKRIQAALDRLEGGSYGECMECGDEIASKRLKAIPWAELCISCQETSDRRGTGQKSYGSPRELRKAA
jgi:RNA polymerase-binding protein DksA